MYIFVRMTYIIIYVIISSKGLQIKINIFSMLSPDVYIYIYIYVCVCGGRHSNLDLVNTCITHIITIAYIMCVSMYALMCTVLMVLMLRILLISPLRAFTCIYISESNVTVRNLFENTACLIANKNCVLCLDYIFL